MPAKHLLGVAVFSCLLGACNPSRSAAPRTPAGETPHFDAMPAHFAPSAAVIPFNDPRVIPFNDPWTKKWWITKTARLLRGGQGLRASEDLDALAALPDEKIVELFLNDPRFAETVLDFDLYFLGQGKSSLHATTGEFARDVFYASPHAIASAKEAEAGGDFLKLLDLEQPFYQEPLGIFDDFDTPQTDAEIAAKRNALFAETLQKLDHLIEEARASAPKAPPELCKKLNEITIRGLSKVVPFSLSLTLRVHRGWFGPLTGKCFGLAQELDYVAELERGRDRTRVLFDRLLGFETVVYKPKTLDEIKPLDLSGLGLRSTQLSSMLGLTLQNSSTNYNRKRAAYILKHYFCDDLTPINVEQPVFHAGDSQHASDPSCFACHYKLDPMAGYFKDLGFFFSDFSASKTMVFDDNATMDRLKYQEAWKAPAGSPYGAWNIGYIRSVTDPAQNTYGTNVEDLFALIRTAPEVKRCLVKRMFEYFVGPNQVAEGRYLDGLANEFIEGAKSNSTAAFKTTVSRLVLSNVFRRPDPRADECYDFGPGYDPAKSPPCRIAYTLEKNCVSCHKMPASADPHALPDKLDLTEWITLPDGSRDFLHIRAGKQVSRKDTFQAILDRLTTSNPDDRMPQRKSIDHADLEQLFKWINSILAEPRELR